MKKLELEFSIISFMIGNRHLKITDLGFKNPLVLSNDDNSKSVIEQYYAYDVTVFVYENSKNVAKYQECYADLSLEILEKIYDQIQIYSNELKNNLETA